VNPPRIASDADEVETLISATGTPSTPATI
jgi:hypothetical protein